LYLNNNQLTGTIPPEVLAVSCTTSREDVTISPFLKDVVAPSCSHLICASVGRGNPTETISAMPSVTNCLRLRVLMHAGSNTTT